MPYDQAVRGVGLGLEARTASGTNFEATVESLQHSKEEPPLF